MAYVKKTNRAPYKTSRSTSKRYEEIPKERMKFYRHGTVLRVTDEEPTDLPKLYKHLIALKCWPEKNPKEEYFPPAGTRLVLNRYHASHISFSIVGREGTYVAQFTPLKYFTTIYKS